MIAYTDGGPERERRKMEGRSVQPLKTPCRLPVKERSCGPCSSGHPRTVVLASATEPPRRPRRAVRLSIRHWRGAPWATWTCPSRQIASSLVLQSICPDPRIPWSYERSWSFTITLTPRPPSALMTAAPMTFSDEYGDHVGAYNTVGAVGSRPRGCS